MRNPWFQFSHFEQRSCNDDKRERNKGDEGDEGNIRIEDGNYIETGLIAESLVKSICGQQSQCPKEYKLKT
jgi:hypothetical protein